MNLQSEILGINLVSFGREIRIPVTEMPPLKATHRQTKQHNRDLVLRTIFANESISRAEIARVTHLTRTTVSDVVSGLLAEGLVEEVGRGESLGGKSPILLSIVADSRYLIGLNLAQDKFTGAVVNLRGEIKARVESPSTTITARTRSTSSTR